MSIKIAFISSTNYKNTISSIAQNIDGIQIQFYTYNHPSETIQLLHQLEPCDALVIGGFIPYSFVEPYLSELSIPYFSIMQDEHSVSTTLLHVLTSQKIQLHELSIDVIDEKLVTNTLSDMDYSGDKPAIFSSLDSALYAQHIALYKANSIKLIVTSVHTLYERLLAENIPVITMRDSTSSTIEKLKSIRANTLLHRSNNQRAAAGIIQCNPTDFPSFFTFTENIHANFKKRDEYSYEISTTFGALQSFLNSPSLIDHLHSFKSPFKMGFGYGQSFIEAMNHANEAIQFSKDYEIYLLNERSELSGPFPNEKKKISLHLNDEKMKELALKTSLSALNLSKFLDFIYERHTKQFTAQDLADYMHVTRRTAERIIKKLLEAHFIQVISAEMSYQKGRPRAIYSLAPSPNYGNSNQ